MEKIILRELYRNEKFIRAVSPYIKPDYFDNQSTKLLFDQIFKYFISYNSLPTREALTIELDKVKGIAEKEYEILQEDLKEITSAAKDDPAADFNWLMENTEQFCKEKALHNAIGKSIQILGGQEKNLDKGAIPSLLTEALSISFDPKVGHDYVDDAEARYDLLHSKEARLPFHLDYFNKITNGGIIKKTLNIIMAGTNVGKSLFMCDYAAYLLSQGKNVLYITLEMAEEKIAERIDANLMDIAINDMEKMAKSMFMERFQRMVAKKKLGKLKIKEYPNGGGNVLHFANLLAELKNKSNFVPDIIFVDYLNICSSARLKADQAANSYKYVKSIAEELRALATEANVPIVSATQTNRTGFSDTDIDLTSTSESFGLPMTVDFMVAIIRTDELEELNQLMVKQLKNRYNTTLVNKRFVIGVDYPKMKLYDVEQAAQEGLADSGQKYPTKPFKNKPKFDPETGEIQEDVPLMDKTSFGSRSLSRDKFKELSV